MKTCYPVTKKVAWQSKDIEYQAMKLEGIVSQTTHLIDATIDTILGSGARPTVIIASLSCIREIHNLFMDRLTSDDRMRLYYPNTETPVALQADHRINGGLLYILYEDMEPRALEAVEFEGLATLP